MNMKKFTTLATSVFVALLVSAFAFTVVGCGDPETEYVDKWNTSYVEVGGGGGGFQPPEDTIFVTTEAALRGLLQDTNEGTANIGVSGTILGSASLSDVLTIPADKNLYVSAGSTTITKDITVSGKLHVYGGTLTTTAASGRLLIDGEVIVERGGSLSDGTNLEEINAVPFTPDTTTVGSKVKINEGGTLKVQTADIAAAAATYKNTLAGTWGFADEGSLTVTGDITTDTAATLAAVTAFSGLDSGNRTLTVTISSPNDGVTITSLTIPAGLELTTTVALTEVTDLTVNGSLTTSATLAKVTSVIVNGTLAAASGSLIAATTVTVNKYGSLTAGAAAIAGAATTVTVGDNATLILNSGSGTIAKLAAPLEIGVRAIFQGTISATDNQAINIKEAAIVTIVTTTPGTTVTNANPGASVNGITIPGNAVTAAKLTGLATNAAATLEADFTVPAGGILNVGAGKTLTLKEGTTLTLTGGANINGGGTVVAAKTQIVGGADGWQAVGPATATIAIAAIDADTSSITASADTVVLKAMGGTPTITQLAGNGNELTIGENTTIDLNCDIATPTTVGSIVLKEHGTLAGGTITLPAATSIIQVSNENNGSALSASGGKFQVTGGGTPATTKITVSSFSNVLVYPGTTTTGKVNQITGGAASGSLSGFVGATDESVISAGTTVS